MSLSFTLHAQRKEWEAAVKAKSEIKPALDEADKAKELMFAAQSVAAIAGKKFEDARFLAQVTTAGDAHDAVEAASKAGKKATAEAEQKHATYTSLTLA
jgi:hypothetical protein